MITTQADLDRCLDRIHTIQVEISPAGPLPRASAYDPVRTLPQSGFTFTPRELLHAIGCKTAAIPESESDECLKYALLYTCVLDLQGPYLSFQGTYGSDLQALRSQETGLGMMCLVVEKHFGIPWDQLGPLPAPGKRFDYRGTNGSLDCIFESKGTSHIEYQPEQIDHGIEKKAAYHGRGEHFDVELVISTFIGHGEVPPRVVLAEPDQGSLRKLFERGDERYYRLKHYCRVLQFVGLPFSAYHLNLYAMDYLKNRPSIHKTMIREKGDRDLLESITIGGDEFLGRWFDSWVPKDSKRYKKLAEREKRLGGSLFSKERIVFQGLRRDIYESGLEPEPFSRPLIEKSAREKYRTYDKAGVSVFPDGTVMVFRQS